MANPNLTLANVMNALNRMLARSDTTADIQRWRNLSLAVKCVELDRVLHELNQNIPDDLTDNLDLLMPIINQARNLIVPPFPAEQVDENELNNPPEEVVDEDENEEDADAEDYPNEENEPLSIEKMMTIEKMSHAEELDLFRANMNARLPFIQPNNNRDDRRLHARILRDVLLFLWANLLVWHLTPR